MKCCFIFSKIPVENTLINTDFNFISFYILDFSGGTLVHSPSYFSKALIIFLLLFLFCKVTWSWSWGMQSRIKHTNLVADLFCIIFIRSTFDILFTTATAIQTHSICHLGNCSDNGSKGCWMLIPQVEGG